MVSLAPRRQPAYCMNAAQDLPPRLVKDFRKAARLHDFV
jgi:hypothetical protein